MLSYQHGYHAGAFADVVKHFTLVSILRYLCRKEKPFFYLETHAGKGLYDLKSLESQKTGEARLGIEQLWMHQTQLSDLFIPYLESIQKCNPDGDLRYYPGSPVLAMHHMRPIDRLYCCELHPREYQELQRIKRIDREIKIHLSHCNGLDQLAALLPPPERRGLVFIDPSYEIKIDYRQIPDFVGAAYRRFNKGVYCIWYPIVEERWNVPLIANLAKINAPSLRVEFNVMDVKNPGMTGCGLWVINPPFVLAAELKAVLPELVQLFNPGVSSYNVQCLNVA